MAYVFHFQPSEIWAMKLPELFFWADEAGRIYQAMPKL
ncbi:MAG: GpE family phage tail protein [Candidatus Accumulibacter sp.]|nr:GpE family phage tail protein [Accumulibacter sp.]